MHRALVVFVSLVVVCGLSGRAAGEPNDAAAQNGDPCACALLNFWDTVPREEASQCCAAMEEICTEEDGLRCGHVHRFCMKHKAGYSAWILDNFVRDKLRGKGCAQFNPDATHEAEKCGEGWCKIGYICTTIRAEKCDRSRGLRCGPGYCPRGSHCAEMSSQNCEHMSRADAKQYAENGDVEVECTGQKCSVCATETEHQCVLENGLGGSDEVRSPCDGRDCADSVVCGLGEESVCSIRPDVLFHLGDEADVTHKPESVSADKLRRFAAIAVPTLGGITVGILVVALISWSTVRIRRARKEAAALAREDAERNKAEEEQEHDGPSIQKMETIPLSPGRAPKPRFQLPLGGEPPVVQNSARSNRSTGRRLWTPRSGYQSMSDCDLDAPSMSALGHEQVLRGTEAAPDYDGDYSDASESEPRVRRAGRHGTVKFV